MSVAYSEEKLLKKKSGGFNLGQFKMAAILDFWGQFHQFLKADISRTDWYFQLKFGVDSYLYIMKLHTEFGENLRRWVSGPCWVGMEWPLKNIYSFIHLFYHLWE